MSPFYVYREWEASSDKDGVEVDGRSKHEMGGGVVQSETGRKSTPLTSGLFPSWIQGITSLIPLTSMTGSECRDGPCFGTREGGRTGGRLGPSLVEKERKKTKTCLCVGLKNQ